jgi:glycosyltransferase involved in cell wall biosynthesis
MRLIHVVPAVSEEASGPSYVVTRLCTSLTDLGEDLTLATMNLAPCPSRSSYLKLFPVAFGPRRLGRSPKMYRWLVAEAASGNVDIIHNHGLWQMNAVYPGWSVRGTAAQLVVSPHGAFSPWAMGHGSSLKRVAWPMVQRPSLGNAACFHATAQSECEEIRQLGFTQPIAVIPPGIDLPHSVARSEAHATRTVLFLGRIHPKKGIDVLVRAWAGIHQRHRDWTLSIVGSDTVYSAKAGYLDQLKRLAASLHVERIEFLDPLYGPDKWTAYAKADLFVLPTHSENFAMTVAESLASETPAIVTRGAPWQGLEQHRCGWWIEHGVDPLDHAVLQGIGQSREQIRLRAY